MKHRQEIHLTLPGSEASTREKQFFKVFGKASRGWKYFGDGSGIGCSEVDRGLTPYAEKINTNKATHSAQSSKDNTTIDNQFLTSHIIAIAAAQVTDRFPRHLPGRSFVRVRSILWYIC